MENYSLFYAGFLEQQAGFLRGSNQRQAFETIALEFENILIAWEWLVEHKQVPVAVERMLPALFLLRRCHHSNVPIGVLKTSHFLPADMLESFV